MIQMVVTALGVGLLCTCIYKYGLSYPNDIYKYIPKE